MKSEEMTVVDINGRQVLLFSIDGAAESVRASLNGSYSAAFLRALADKMDQAAEKLTEKEGAI